MTIKQDKEASSRNEPAAIITVSSNCGGRLRAKRAIDHRGISGETIK